MKSSTSHFGRIVPFLHLAVVVSSQTWLDKNCKCKDNAPPDTTFSLTPINTWSACKDWIEEDGDDPGCYSGIQERNLKCSYRSIDGSNNEQNTVNDIAPSCLEYQRCLSQGRTCDGYWGQWSTNGPCNCTTNKRTHSRYCNKKTGSKTDEKLVVSIHCIGSGGHFEQNRTVSCTRRTDCLKTPTSPKQASPTRTKPNQEHTTGFSTPIRGTNGTSTQPQTNQENNRTIDKTDAVTPLSQQTLIIAIVAVSVAFLAIMMLVITCLMRRRKRKLSEKSAYNQPVPPPPESPTGGNGTNVNSSYMANSLYRPYPSQNGDAYDMPYPGNMTQSRRAKRAATTRDSNAGIDSASAIMYRDRSATVARLQHDHGIDAPYNELHRSVVLPLPLAEGQYAIPVDHIASGDDEIYWSIDEGGPLRPAIAVSTPYVLSSSANVPR